ncbi:MAG: vanadium-dependent haloperoxidase [Bacteroidota bacterium]
MRSMKINVLWSLLLTSYFFLSCESDEPADPNTAVDSPVSELSNRVIYDWTTQLLALERYSSGRPNGSARALAYIYMTAYETAVPGMPNFISNASRLDGLEIKSSNADEIIDYNIAINACMSKSVDHFLRNLPSDLRNQITELELSLQTEFSSEVSETVIKASTEWGIYVADQIIAYSVTDTEAEEQILDPQPTSYEPPTGDGFWTFSAEPERALFPYWSSVRTFVISPEETSSIPPISYSTSHRSDYYQQMKEVYEVNNNAREEDGEDLWIAEFWSDDVEGLMMSPPARQVSIANQLINQYELNLEESLELLVKLGFSLNDAAVSTWKYKYEYMVMRPNVFIHEYIDPDFQTNLYRLVFWPNPSFPGYPSGHSCFASAAGGVFIDFFGNDTDFTDRTHEGREEFRGSPRTFSSFEKMAKENAYSRVPLGVHVEMDCEEGLRLGYEIADAINKLQLENINN